MVTLNKVFLIEGNVTIYHAYKETGRSLVYHYSIDPDQCRTFDVRDLPGSERLDSLERWPGGFAPPLGWASSPRMSCTSKEPGMPQYEGSERTKVPKVS